MRTTKLMTPKNGRSPHATQWLALLAGALVAAATAGEKATYLGVVVTRVDDTLREQLKLKRGVGLKVQETRPDSPAAKAGVKAHDILEKLDDQLLFTAQQFAELVRSYAPGDKAQLALVRQGQPQKLEVSLGEHDAPQFAGEEEMEAGPGHLRLWLDRATDRVKRGAKLFEIEDDDAPEPALKGGAFLGVAARPVEPSLAAHLDLEKGAGVVVGEVAAGSPAEKAGVKENDLLLKVDQERLHGPADLVKRIQAHKQGDAVKLELLRGGKPQTLEVTLAEREKPATNRSRKIIRERRLGPGGAALELPDGPGKRVVIIKGAGPDEAVVREVHAGQGEAKVEVRAVARGDGKPVVVTTTTESSSATHAEGEPAPGKGKHGAKVSVIVAKNDDGEITWKEENGKKSVTAKDPQGKELFNGPASTPAERSKMPEAVRKQVEKLEADVKSKGASMGEAPEVHLHSADSAGDVI